MTNEQLVVLIGNYRNQLITAKDEVERNLPGYLKKKGKGFLNIDTTYFEETQPLYRLIDGLEEDIEQLGKKA